jgi:folate-binding protein YgfZ
MNSAVYCELPEWSILQIDGSDRASFLHNLCTNEVKALSAGQGREAFITNVQGKTIGHVFFGVETDHILLHTAPGQNELLMNHLDRYHITEDVTLSDRTNDLCATWVIGPVAKEWFPNELHAPYHCGRLDILGSPWSQNVPIVDPFCMLAIIDNERYGAFVDQLHQAGATKVSAETIEVARIEHGFPKFAADISDANLPQEIDRDELAISFTKGCYLGQETVARLDALGHVNKKLVSLKFSNSHIPEVGSKIENQDANEVGVVTSACYSPKYNSGIGIGMVRTKNLDNSELTCESHPALIRE